MPRYVVFLRAINVTGRYLRMAELAAHVRSLGHVEVATYINSGNVVFTSSARDAARLAAALQTGLEPLLGFRAEAFVRPFAALHQIAERAHALTGALGTAGEVNVGFLPAPPSAAQCAALETLQTERDRLLVDGTELYWSCTGNQADSKVSNAAVERRLGMRTTFRRSRMLQGLSQQLRR